MEDRTNMVQRKDGRDDNRIQDMEEGSSEDESEETPSSQPAIQPPLPPVPDKVLVKKYDPKQGNDFYCGSFDYFINRENRSLRIKYNEITRDLKNAELYRKFYLKKKNTICVSIQKLTMIQ